MAKGNIEEVRVHIDRDKQTAKAVRQAAQEEIRGEYFDPVAEDITGAPSELGSFRKFKQEQELALHAIKNDLYFAKVETQVRRANGAEEDRTYLVTKSRYSGGELSRDGWMVVSWTAPITSQILSKDVGERVVFELPKRPPQDLTVTAAADYGEILPTITHAFYALPSGEVFFDDENDLVGEQVIEPTREAPPEQEYKAADEFGLREIIELADAEQRSAMHLPFHDTVLVEGPPGSGKTSIALMRVPCLIDRQWEELGLDPNDDPPFHDVSRMRVLVMNEEMIDYLSTLIRSVGVHGLQVTSLPKYCRRLCSEAGTLAGVTVNEPEELTWLKHHPQMLPAYWAGFKQSVASFWANGIDEYINSGRALNDEWATVLRQRLDAWKSRLLKAEFPDGNTVKAPNLADALARWQLEVEQTIPDETFSPNSGQAERELLHRFKEEVQRLVKSIFDRRRLVESTIKTDEFVSLLSEVGVGARQRIVDEWMEQTKHDVQHMSDGDLLLHAWLATHLMLRPVGSKRRSFGAANPGLTHVVIDEAQDVAAGHIQLVKQLLRDDGTLTLVGDLRQRVSHGGFFGNWKDLSLGKYTKAIFGINHRQSNPLGSFVRELHRCLFGTEAEWRASTKRSSAPKPRLRPKRGYAGLASVVAEEVRAWRQEIPNATVGILYHGKRWNRASNLAQRIEERLGDTLTEVRVANNRDTGQLARTDCAIIASVENTKGLEFDAVVFLDRHQEWKGATSNVSEVAKNGLYVAASRARQGLSLLIDDRSELLSEAFDRTAYDLIPVVVQSDDDDRDTEDFIDDDSTEDV